MRVKTKQQQKMRMEFQTVGIYLNNTSWKAVSVSHDITAIPDNLCVHELV